MGGNHSKRASLCCSGKRQEEQESQDPEQKSAEERFWIEANKDKYFKPEDYEEIAQKFPDHHAWIEQSMRKSSKTKTTQKEIQWREGETIGKGSNGEVKIGLNLRTGGIMAIKQVKIVDTGSGLQEDRVRALETEISLLKKLSHKNIVKYYGSKRTNDTLNILLEYVPGGSIASLLERFGPLTVNIIRVYTRQILEGLEYLHVRNTIHRDIKGANILVDSTGVCKLTDFGTAAKIHSIYDKKKKQALKLEGTLNWMAPEALKQTFVGRQSDIWSVGCTVLEMATGKVPWFNLVKGNTNSMSVLYQIVKAKTHPPIPNNLPREMVDFLHQCFKLNPYERPNVIELLRHKFVTGNESIPKPLASSCDGRQRTWSPNSDLLSSKDRRGNTRAFTFSTEEYKGDISSRQGRNIQRLYEESSPLSALKSSESKSCSSRQNPSPSCRFRIRESNQQNSNNSDLNEESGTPKNPSSLYRADGQAADKEQESLERLEEADQVLVPYFYRMCRKDSDVRSRDSDCESNAGCAFPKKFGLSRQNTERGLNSRLGSEESIMPNKNMFGLMFLQRRQTTARYKAENEEDRKFNGESPLGSEWKTVDGGRQGDNWGYKEDRLSGIMEQTLEMKEDLEQKEEESFSMEEFEKSMEKFNLNDDLEKIYQKIEETDVVLEV